MDEFKLNRRLSTFAACKNPIKGSVVSLAKKGLVFDLSKSKVVCESCGFVQQNLGLNSSGNVGHNPGCQYLNLENIERQDQINSIFSPQTIRNGVCQSVGGRNLLEVSGRLQRSNSSGSADSEEEEEEEIRRVSSDVLTERTMGHELVSRNLTSRRFNVEPREVKARLDTPIVRSIIENGTPAVIVRRAIERRLMAIGDDFSSAQSLLRAVFEIENEDIEDQLLDNDDVSASNYDTECPSSSDFSAVDLNPEWTCKICLDAEVRVVFLPCAHLVSCNRCAARLHACPICRTRILRTIKASFE